MQANIPVDCGILRIGLITRFPSLRIARVRRTGWVYRWTGICEIFYEGIEENFANGLLLGGGHDALIKHCLPSSHDEMEGKKRVELQGSKRECT
jgi:hypothetical protein